MGRKDLKIVINFVSRRQLINLGMNKIYKNVNNNNFEIVIHNNV